MPIYDLICTNCGYEKGETIFSSYAAFENARKERECPECHSLLEAKLSSFSINGTTKTTGGKVMEEDIAIHIELGKMPCGHIMPKEIRLVRAIKIRHDPEMN